MTHAERTLLGPPLVIVPEWVLDADVSAQAVRLYALLATYVGHASPTRSTLAGRMRCSVDTVDRALRELVSIGAVSRSRALDERGGYTANDYTVHALPAQPTSGAL